MRLLVRQVGGLHREKCDLGRVYPGGFGEGLRVRWC